jgi:hypothetical protein
MWKNDRENVEERALYVAVHYNEHDTQLEKFNNFKQQQQHQFQIFAL